jgi:hypothetical protein
MVAITSDNEASVKSACTTITHESVRFSCMAHNLNLIVQNGFKLWNKPNNEYINVTNLFSKYYK